MVEKGETRVFQADFLTELFRHPLDPAYAQAAADREVHGPLPKPRLFARKTVSFLVLAAIGLLLAVAYQQVVREAPTQEKVRSSLIEQILAKRESNRELAGTAEQLQSEVATLRDQAIGDPAQIEQLRQLDGLTGQRRVIGDGVVVELSDGPDADSIESQQVISFDLLKIVNELWSLGAEAISVNDQRLTSLTQISSGEGNFVGATLVTSPYQIVAVGPADLYDRFRDSPTAKLYRGWHEDPKHRFGFSVSEQDDLTLPAAVLPPELAHAKVPGPTPSATPLDAAPGSPSPTPSGGGR
jgi:uncharacterized protein YlxW (UPF0749 family)